MADANAPAGPLVSVIVPAFNAERYLGEALQSVLGQTYPHLEVLVVDDGSADRSVEIARGFGDRVRVFTQANGGPAAARNRGLENAKGAYVSFLDADDTWLPDKTERQVAFMEAHPEVGVSYGPCLFVKNGRELTRIGWEPEKFPEGWIFEHLLLERGFISINTVMVRRRCLERVGSFNESLRTAEDTNMFLRLARQCRFGFIPDPLARYRWHETSLTKRTDVERGTFRALEHISTLYPELHPSRSPLMRKAYALRHLMRASGSFNRGEHAEARRQARAALGYRPLLWRAWLLLAVCLIPPTLVHAFRRLRHGRA